MKRLLPVNKYLNVTVPKVIENLSVYDWLKLIKDSDYSELIQNARQGIFPKHPITQLPFTKDEVKRSLPCVTYNFLYDEYKKDDNLTVSTGLMYLDIDSNSFDIKTIDKSKVFAYYSSFGGSGYAILVRVNGVTKSNFRLTYEAIVSDLGLNKYIDTAAIKHSQFNVLSYDSELYINDNPFVYNAWNQNAPIPSVIEKKEKAYTKGLGAKKHQSIRFDNLDEIEVNGKYVIDWDGIEYIRCFLPIKKVTRNRNNFLLSYCNNLVYLNQNISIEKTVEILSNVNRSSCTHPVDEAQIKRVVNSIFHYKVNGSLKPIIFNKKRRLVFNKNYNLTREEKLGIWNAEQAKMWSRVSTNKLYEILENWDFEKHGKISQRKIYNNHPMGKTTVEKYYKVFVDFIDKLNSAYLNQNNEKEETSIEEEVDSTNFDIVPIEVLYTDEVVDIRKLLVGLYRKANEDIDAGSIIGIMNVINKNTSRISEIVQAITMVIRENKYGNSPYKEIKIPMSVIELIREYKFGVVQFLYSEAA